MTYDRTNKGSMNRHLNPKNPDYGITSKHQCPQCQGWRFWPYKKSLCCADCRHVQREEVVWPNKSPPPGSLPSVIRMASLRCSQAKVRLFSMEISLSFVTSYSVSMLDWPSPPARRITSSSRIKDISIRRWLLNLKLDSLGRWWNDIWAICAPDKIKKKDEKWGQHLHLRTWRIHALRAFRAVQEDYYERP